MSNTHTAITTPDTRISIERPAMKMSEAIEIARTVAASGSQVTITIDPPMARTILWTGTL